MRKKKKGEEKKEKVQEEGGRTLRKLPLCRQVQIPTSTPLTADFTRGYTLQFVWQRHAFEAKVVIIAEDPASSNSLNVFLPEI